MVLASVVVSSPPVAAQSPAGSPGTTRCESSNPAAARSMHRRSNISLFYDLGLAIVSGRLFEWRGDGPVRVVGTKNKFAHVAVSARHGHGIDTNHSAWRWAAGSDALTFLLDDVAFLAAGESSLLAIRCDGSLWQHKAEASGWSRVADAAIHAWVGDSSDYYIEPGGSLYASGKAHRGQYGNGRLEEVSGWTRVADNAVAVYSHTGHAVYLRQDGAVLGTGGNRFGPLATHGYGDKATHWGVIFEAASGLGTGASHSMAIRPNGSLWSWGSSDGLQPKVVLQNVSAAIGGDSATLAQTKDGSVWQWRVGTAPKQLVMPP